MKEYLEVKFLDVRKKSTFFKITLIVLPNFVVQGQDWQNIVMKTKKTNFLIFFQKNSFYLVKNRILGNFLQIWHLLNWLFLFQLIIWWASVDFDDVWFISFNFFFKDYF
jgi:hypothetical protein